MIAGEASPVSELRYFTVDQEGAIDHFIHSQSGTVPKALLELLMNAIDSGSTLCDIVLTPKYFSVRDLGKGFIDADEIELKFGHFAQNRDNSDSVYARFRIGRGQCMSLAKMSWRSNEFKIETDIAEQKGAYVLTKGLKKKPGCFVEGRLYRPISQWDFDRMIEEISVMFKYALVPVTLNGILVNPACSERYWDVNTPDFCIKYNPDRGDGVHLFNLGVFVRALNYENYGFNADIVSKIPLTLNMSRNEVHDSDPTYPLIAEVLKAKAIEVAREKQKKQKLDEVSRRSLIKQFLSGELPWSEAIKFTLLRDCRGHYIKLSSLWGSKIPLTISEEGFENVADALVSSRIAQVLHPDERRLWRCDDAAGLIEVLLSLVPQSREGRFYRNRLMQREVALFFNVSRGIVSSHTVIKTNKLCASKRATINALNYVSPILANRLNSARAYIESGVHEELTVRKVVPGESQTAVAWTDGGAMIAFNENILELPQKGLWGAHYLCHVLLHEYTHDGSDTDGHNHDLGFYQRYHDATLGSYGDHEVLGHVLASFITRYLSECEKNGVPIPSDMTNRHAGNQIKEFDLYFNGKRGLSDFSMKLIQAAGLQVNKKGKVWSLVFNGHKVDAFKSRKPMFAMIDKMMVEQGMSGTVKRDAPEIPLSLRDHRQYEERGVWVKNEDTARVSAFLQKMKLPEVYAQLLYPSYLELRNLRMPESSRYAEHCLSLICADPTNDARHFTSKLPNFGNRVGGPSYVMNLDWTESSKEGFYKRELARKEPALVGNHADLQRCVLRKMKAALDSITDEGLKAKFIEDFIPEKLAFAMGVKGEREDSE